MLEVHDTTCCHARFHITITKCDRLEQFIVRTHAVPEQMSFFEDAESVSVVPCDDLHAVYARLHALERVMRHWYTVRAWRPSEGL